MSATHTPAPRPPQGGTELAELIKRINKIERNYQTELVRNCRPKTEPLQNGPQEATELVPYQFRCLVPFHVSDSKDKFRWFRQNTLPAHAENKTFQESAQ